MGCNIWNVCFWLCVCHIIDLPDVVSCLTFRRCDIICAAWFSFKSLLLIGRECWEKSLGPPWAIKPKPCSIMSVTAASLFDNSSRIRRAFFEIFSPKTKFLFIIDGDEGWFLLLLLFLLLSEAALVFVGSLFDSLQIVFTLVFSLSTSGGVVGGSRQN